MKAITAINHARRLRKDQTLFEQQLWRCLRDRRFLQFKFRRQHPIGPYIVDFVCLQYRLVIELDGSQHAENSLYDLERDQRLNDQGYRVLSVWNNQWTCQQESVLQAILNKLK